MLPDEGSCCQLGCIGALEESITATKGLKELKMCLGQLADLDEKNKLIYDCLRQWQTADHGWRRFLAWNIPICNTALETVLGCSRGTLHKLCSHLKQGFREPPSDGRRLMRATMPLPQVERAHVLLGWIYTNVAEVLVESSDFGPANMKAKMFDPGVKGKASPSDGSKSWLEVAPEYQEVKWLSPGTTILDMYDLSVAFVGDEDLPAYRTFSRCYYGSCRRC